MIKYDAVYVDKEGDIQDFVIDASSVREAIKQVLYFCPDARRVIRCTPKPMFDTEGDL